MMAEGIYIWVKVCVRVDVGVTTRYLPINVQMENEVEGVDMTRVC